MIDIKGIDKAELLMALYNNARVSEMCWCPATENLTLEEAQEYLEEHYGSFHEYLFGRVMKVRIHGDTLDPVLYDRDNGEGAAGRAIAHLRGEKS